MTFRLVVLVSGSGTNLQALLDACANPGYGAEIVAVGADREGIEGLARGAARGIPTFVVKVDDYVIRDQWDKALTEACATHDPDLVVSAGFRKLVGPSFLDMFGGRQSARTLHTIGTVVLVLFVIVHVLEIAAAGLFTKVRSMITGS